MPVSGAIAAIVDSAGKALIATADNPHGSTMRNHVVISGTTKGYDGLRKVLTLPGVATMRLTDDYIANDAVGTWSVSNGLRGRTRGRLRTQI